MNASGMGPPGMAAGSTYFCALGGFVKLKKCKKNDISMEVGGWVQVSLGKFKKMENHPKIVLT